ncbi:NrfD/PsrC family molybdoenzyme membrane anchor subunit [Psychromonas ossibalaenae]|uniref:NrfD/PsrC family molybdoenzyme membrane anchor subunit n=1 Tax=Psychromonas ossibalaenae TaxID=444922 RepID=UPI00035E8483|nr:NrfD/PsrC family molybdoenzyme membrane anchor subunit [Psychromonas ossibalaenae]
MFSTVGFDLFIPVLMNQFSSVKLKHSSTFIAGSAVLTLLGVMSLIMFTLYAGQMTRFK